MSITYLKSWTDEPQGQSACDCGRPGWWVTVHLWNYSKGFFGINNLNTAWSQQLFDLRFKYNRPGMRRATCSLRRIPGVIRSWIHYTVRSIYLSFWALCTCIWLPLWRRWVTNYDSWHSIRRTDLVALMWWNCGLQAFMNAPLNHFKSSLLELIFVCLFCFESQGVTPLAGTARPVGNFEEICLSSCVWVSISEYRDERAFYRFCTALSRWLLLGTVVQSLNQTESERNNIPFV